MTDLGQSSSKKICDLNNKELSFHVDILRDVFNLTTLNL